MTSETMSAEMTVAAEMLLLEAERQLDYEKRKSEIFHKAYNKMRNERNEYRRGFENILWYIEKMMLAPENQFVNGVCEVAFELEKQIEESIKKHESNNRPR